MELEELIYRIFAGKIILDVDGDLYTVRSPSLHLRYNAEIYKKSLREKYKYELPLLESYVLFLITSRFIDSDYEKKIQAMNDGIKNLKIDLFNAGSKIDLDKKIRKNLKTIKENLSKYYSKIEFFKSSTLEYFCESLKNKYILLYTLYKDDNLLFDKNSFDLYLFNNIIDRLNRVEISTEQYREIARSSSWRNYWLGNKNNLFGIPAIEFSEEQKILCMFSRMYDNAYENPECPDDKIIEDDDKFDGWLFLQQTKNKDERKKNKYSHIDSKYSEIFVAASSQEEANEIYDDNSIDSRRILKERSQILKQKGLVRDIDFVDNRLDIMEKSSKAAMNNLKK